MQNPKPSIKNNPTLAKLEQQINVMKLIISSKHLYGVWGINPDDIVDIEKELVKLENQFAQVIEITDKFNSYFGIKGWISHNGLQLDLQHTCVGLAEKGKSQEAEEILIDLYDEKYIRLRILLMMFIPEFKPRERLILLALEDYLAGRYHACIPVVIAQIDGLVNDITKRGFFAKVTILEVEDSIVAHSTGLPILQRVFSKDRINTSNEEIKIPYRNGILHGTDLKYDNRIVAAKVWGTLFALRDWVIDLRQHGKKQQIANISLNEQFDRIIETRQETQLIKQWQPRSDKVIKECIENVNNGILNNKPESVLVSLLNMWIVRKYGLMVPLLSKVHHKGTTNATAGWLRTLLGSSKLEKYEIKQVKDENTFCTDIFVDILIVKKEQISETFKIRVLHEDDNGEIISADNPKGKWKVLFTPIIGITQDY